MLASEVRSARGGVRDVAFVPERDALHDGHDLGADDAGEAGDPFGQDGVLLVRHRRRPFLPDAERLRELAHLGALPVPYLQCDRLAEGGMDGDRADPLGNAVAHDDLGRHRRRSEAECLGDAALDVRGRCWRGAAAPDAS